MSKEKKFNPKRDENDFKERSKKRPTKKKKQSRSKEEDVMYDRKRDHGNNDLSWHVSDPQILRDIASLPFSNVLADGLSITTDYDSGGNPIDSFYATPGILTLNYQPSYGANFTAEPGSITGIDFGSRWQSNPLNMGMRALRAYLRANNSGSTNNLDDTDYMQYILAMDSAYMIWAWAVRLYGYLNTFSFKNRYAPEGLLGAFGIQTANQQTSLYSNMAQLRYFINTFALRMSSLAVPTVFPIISRHMWMVSNVFKDSEDPKAQLYVFNPVTYYTYDEANGVLVAHDFMSEIGGAQPVTSLRNIFNNILNPLLASQSVGIMSGDILKAYGGNIYNFSAIPSEYSLVPEYRADVLPMIHNTQATGVLLGDIKQKNDCLYTEISAQGVMRKTSADLILNLPYDLPSPEDVLYGTRFMANWSFLGTAGDGTDIYEYICGTENIVSMKLTADPADGSPTYSNLYTENNLSAGATTTQRVNFLTSALTISSLMHQFDWAPYLIYRDLGVTNGVYDMSLFSGDLCNFTTISKDTLASIHDGDFCGMYNIPYTMTGR